jgi:hypothetical protein
MKIIASDIEISKLATLDMLHALQLAALDFEILVDRTHWCANANKKNSLPRLSDSLPEIIGDFPQYQESDLLLFHAENLPAQNINGKHAVFLSSANSKVETARILDFFRNNRSLLMTTLFEEELHEELGEQVYTLSKRIIYILPHTHEDCTDASINKHKNRSTQLAIFYDSDKLSDPPLSSCISAFNEVKNIKSYKIELEKNELKKYKTCVNESSRILIITDNLYMIEYLLHCATSSGSVFYSWFSLNKFSRRLNWQNLAIENIFSYSCDSHPSIRSFFNGIFNEKSPPSIPAESCLLNKNLFNQEEIKNDLFRDQIKYVFENDSSNRFNDKPYHNLFSSSKSESTSEENRLKEFAYASPYIHAIESNPSASGIKRLVEFSHPVFASWINEVHINYEQPHWFDSYKFLSTKILGFQQLYGKTIEQNLKKNHSSEPNYARSFLYHLGCQSDWDKAGNLLSTTRSEGFCFNNFLVGMWSYNNYFSTFLNPANCKKEKKLLSKSLEFWKYDIDQNLGDYNAPACWFSLYGILAGHDVENCLSIFNSNRRASRLLLQFALLPLALTDNTRQLKEELKGIDKTLVLSLFNYTQFEKNEVMALYCLLSLAANEVQLFQEGFNLLIQKTQSFDLRNWANRQSFEACKNRSIVYAVAILELLQLHKNAKTLRNECAESNHNEVVEHEWLIQKFAAFPMPDLDSAYLCKIASYFS